MKTLLITNNPLVKEELSEKITVKYYEVDYLEILEVVRDEIHKGSKLLTHPLSGSVKPYETPYKSIIIEEKQGELDMDSLMIIEQSIDTTKKFIKGKEVTEWTSEIKEDFQVIDLSIINNALSSIK
ncbi:GrdX family protein [Sporosalibacterium faouarense]|uniref:GrdX family protein n=1 Tax=Sporosalibacterium faouarense TaxID=516123 RepID=UPI001FAEC314|nr:GrdX family protein [Sporosalibacterium faouarense]